MTEVRALLALLRENEATERPMSPIDLRIFEDVIVRASKQLTILAPELGRQELRNSVAAELAKVRSLREA